MPVPGWLPGLGPPPSSVGAIPLQRLHLLAGKHQVWTVLIRSTRCRQERSPARLRLQLLCTAPGTLEVEVFKNAWRGTGTVTVHSRR